MLYQVLGDSGERLDAHLNIDGSEFVFHSRGGKLGSPGARNLDYGKALRLVLHRMNDKGLRILGAWVDSDEVSHLERPARQILGQDRQLNDPDALFALLSRNMQAFGRPKGSAYGGSRVKKIRLLTDWAGPAEGFADLLRVAAAQGGRNGSAEATANTQVEIPISNEDREWSEGRPKLVQHLRRERAPGLSRAKKREFVRRNGRLYCERCGMDPVVAFGPDGDACIEVHHERTGIGRMGEGGRTKLADLRCLCANCHRLVHAALRRQK